MRASAASSSAPRSSTGAAARPRTSCAGSATASRPIGSEPPATRFRPGRDVLYRLVTSGTAKGIKAQREDGVVRPLLCLWRDETARATARSRACRSATTRSNRGHRPRPDPRRGAAAAAADPSRRRREPPARARRARDAPARARGVARRRPPARSASTWAAACRPSASTTGCGSSARRCRSTARCAGGRGGLPRRCQALRYERGARATGSRAARRRSRTCSWTPRSRARNANSGLSSSGAPRSWPSRASSTHRESRRARE